MGGGGSCDDDGSRSGGGTGNYNGDGNRNGVPLACRGGPRHAAYQQAKTTNLSIFTTTYASNKRFQIGRLLPEWLKNGAQTRELFFDELAGPLLAQNGDD